MTTLPGWLAMGLWACATPEIPTSDPLPPTPAPDDTAPPDDPVERFRRRMEAAGTEVRDGELFFSTYDGCCEPDAKCFGTNPATPYGTHALPTHPDEAPSVDILGPWGTLPDPRTTRSVRLREDEALVFIGTAPPRSAYFSMRSYQLTRVDAGGNVITTIGSLGEPLNQLTVAADRGVDPETIWGQPLIVITSAGQGVEDLVRAELVAAGFDPAHIHADRMTREVLTMGLGPDADTFGVIWRVALPDDAAADAAYRADPGGVVLRLTPSTPVQITEPHPWPMFTPPGAGDDERAWAGALAELEAAILAAHPGQPSLVEAGEPQYQPTLVCLALGTCAGDLRDRLALVVRPFTLEGEEVAFAYGVNHARTGKASYHNLAVVESLHGLGVLGFHSGDMVGSARAWLPDHPQVDDLFAVALRRDCTGQPTPCLEVPTGCPGVPTGDLMRVTFRAYLEPSTGVAPDPGELLPDRVIKIWPAP